MSRYRAEGDEEPVVYRKPPPTLQRIVLKWAGVVVGAIGLIIVLVMLISLGFGALGRYQSRQNQHNKVANSKVEIQNQDQLLQIAKKKADIRVAEAVGIKGAQDEISKTLTDKYLQWEAIQAQIAVANSGKNNTIIYVPSGNMGVPIVNTIATPGVGVAQGDGG